jgi:hypothetical protein
MVGRPSAAVAGLVHVARRLGVRQTWLTLKWRRLRQQDAAEKAAADDRRSLAAFIERLLEEFLKEHGYLRGRDKRSDRE